MENRSYNTMSEGRSVDLLTRNEKDGFWHRRTRTEKIMIVLCSILTILCISLIIAIAVIANKKSTSGDSTKTVDTTTEGGSVTTATTTTTPISTSTIPSAEECDSPICRSTAEMLRSSINTTVDPCEDFYSYVCSGWIHSNDIPKDKVSISPFESLGENVTNKLKQVLPNTTFDDGDVRTKTKVFYRSCIDNETREREGVDDLLGILEDVQGWPLRGDVTTHYDWERALLYAIKKLAAGWIISLGVAPDSKNTTNNVIQLDQTSLSLGRNELIDRNSSDERVQKILSAHKSYIKNSAQILGSRVNDEELDQQVEEMVEFEKTLAEYTRPEVERRDPESMYHKLTLAELGSMLSDRLDIKSFLQSVFEDIANLTDDTEIIVRELDYLNNTATLLSDGTIKVQTLANYIGWRIVATYGPETTQEFRDAQLEFQRAAMGVESSKPLDDICIGNTNDFLASALGNIYVNSDFDTETKSEVEDMVVNLKTAFRELLKNNTWMNEEVKKLAEDKLEKIMDMIAFPPWINDTQKLNDYYRELGDVTEGKYFANVINVTKFHILKNLKTINEPYNRSNTLLSPPAIVNAFYNPNDNSIIFPAGILNIPFYRVGLPTAINYAGIGSVIGHEITHGFDDEGSQYDGEGNLRKWWPEEVREKFNERAQCFVEQYGNYTEPQTGKKLNGKNTLGENIGDNGGIREAFKAYQLAVSKTGRNEKLPGLDLTPDQLFFVNFGYIWCAKQRTEYLADAIEYNVHSPPRFRVEGSCSNFEEFSNAFSCPPNSTMSPLHRCQLW